MFSILITPPSLAKTNSENREKKSNTNVQNGTTVRILHRKRDRGGLRGLSKIGKINRNFANGARFRQSLHILRKLDHIQSLEKKNGPLKKHC